MMKYTLSLLALLLLFSCQQPLQKEPMYQLIWSDEFDQEETSVNASKWFMETVAPNNGSWYNNELQHYTDRVDNAFVSEGTLKIKAKKEAYTHSGTTQAYTSARLNSKVSFTYGKVEVRAKLPRAQGTWPAIWTLGSNLETVGWPACGEIDIMEQLFEDFDMVQCAVHTPDTHGDNTIVKQVAVSDVTENFHIYGLEWTSESLTFLVDETPYFIYNPENKTPENWPYFNDQYILLNIAMGGNLGGPVDPNFTEDQMEVDYVRVYQKK
jgi:beta-glucanase (GH16 family)